MKLSASITFMFAELPFLDRFAAARAAGFDGVEIQALPAVDLADVRAAVTDAGVAVRVLNVDMGDLFEGGPGLSGVPGREVRFRDALERALDAAEALQAAFLHLGPSLIPDGADRAACLKVYARNARHALGRRRDRNLPTLLLLEAMNPTDMPTALFTRTGEAAAFIRAECPELGLMFDAYHVAMGGEDIAPAYAAVRDLVRHVQFSNVPGRHEPGAGALDVVAVAQGLTGCGYEGWFGAEYRPTRPTPETLAWMPDVAAI